MEKLKEELKQSDYAKHVGLVDQDLNALDQDPRVFDILKSDHYVLATVLNPRFKSYAVSYVPPGPNLHKCKELLLRNLASESELGTHTSPSSVSHRGVAKKKLSFAKKNTLKLSPEIYLTSDPDCRISPPLRTCLATLPFMVSLLKK